MSRRRKILMLLVLWLLIAPFLMTLRLITEIGLWLKDYLIVWLGIKSVAWDLWKAHREILDPGCHQQEFVERMMPVREDHP